MISNEKIEIAVMKEFRKVCFIDRGDHFSLILSLGDLHTEIRIDDFPLLKLADAFQKMADRLRAAVPKLGEPSASLLPPSEGNQTERKT